MTPAEIMKRSIAVSLSLLTVTGAIAFAASIVRDAVNEWRR